jgi:outer membrane protein OmpA-like peptidoglycan-associated protein
MTMRDWKHQRDRETEADRHGSGRVAGKHTLTQDLPIIQRLAHDEGAGDPAAGHATDPAAIAAQGTAGPGGSLPHLDTIQRLFGRHDVGGVRTHVGGDAAAANHALGAEAYAFGDAVGFREAPSLHTAAHEAAHTVQQRGGISVPGGMGAEGDPYERHADAVADKVVAGQSAESLLDGVVAGGNEAMQARSVATAGVQRRPAAAPSQPAVHRQPGTASVVQRTTAGGVTVANMAFSPPGIKDDGATTTRASVQHTATSGAPAPLNWSLIGAAYGATVAPSAGGRGLVTPGTDTVPMTKDKVTLTVKAVDSKQAGAYTTGALTMWNGKVQKAEADRAAFVAGGPYTKANFTTGLNGKFDAIYAPDVKRLTAEVRHAFNFVDDLPGAAKWNNASKAKFITQYKDQMQRIWSGQWQFENVREPRLVWKKLGPITVSARVKVDNAAPHFTANIHKGNFGSAVGGAPGVAHLDAKEIVPEQNTFPAAAPADLARLQAKTPSPILFAAGSAAIPALDQPKLDFVGTMLRTMRQPKFNLTITGHAATGGLAPAAQALSDQRARAVRDAIRAKNPGGAHGLTVVAKGNTAGIAAPAGDKVEIASAVDPGHQNTFPPLAHEFGHMLGLGDEYPNANVGLGGATSHDASIRNAFGGQLGTDMGDTFGKVVNNSEGIMSAAGADVRPTHYVTLWEGLAAAAATAAVPAPAFGQADWKFVGF